MGIDLAAAIDITLLDSTVHTIPTGVVGPVVTKNSPTGALLLGRSSSSLAGLIILPGVIDADYEGEIMILAYTLYPPLIIKKGLRIARLVLLDQHPSLVINEKSRAGEGFGSTGGHLVSLVQETNQRPLLTIRLQYKQESVVLCQVMTDTGADVTILSQDIWPARWPLVSAVDSVQGVGGGQQPQQR